MVWAPHGQATFSWGDTGVSGLLHRRRFVAECSVRETQGSSDPLWGFSVIAITFASSEQKEKKMSNRYITLVVAVVAATALFAAGVAVGQTQRFDDIPTDHYAYDAIEWAVDHGITAGCGDGTNFCPDKNLNRAQTVLFLKRYDDWVLNGRPSPTSGLDAGVGAEAACLYTDQGCPIELTGTFGVPRNTLLVVGRDIAPGHWKASGYCSLAFVTERIKDHPDYIPPGEIWSDWKNDLHRVPGYTGYDAPKAGYWQSGLRGTITLGTEWAVIFESSGRSC